MQVLLIFLLLFLLQYLHANDGFSDLEMCTSGKHLDHKLEINFYCDAIVGAPTVMIQIFDVQPPILSYFLLFGGWRHQRRLEINGEDLYGKNSNPINSIQILIIIGPQRYNSHPNQWPLQIKEEIYQ